ncbi:MAG: twin transmembrane helix small protein [Rhodoferax sp.]|nr:twin transmembrane helix small protein [Rhodoferax sp.]
MKYLVLLAFVAIVGSLGTALYFMLRQGSKGNRMVLALGMRVGLSILLFLCILLAWKLGLIQPTGIASGR